MAKNANGSKQLVSELGLEQEVLIQGQVARERLPELYAAADVVVLTSVSEGIPVTLMEAMAMERWRSSPSPAMTQGNRTPCVFKTRQARTKSNNKTVNVCFIEKVTVLKWKLSP